MSQSKYLEGLRYGVLSSEANVRLRARIETRDYSKRKLFRQSAKDPSHQSSQSGLLVAQVEHELAFLYGDVRRERHQVYIGC